jgi:hypothetical protein
MPIRNNCDGELMFLSNPKCFLLIFILAHLVVYFVILFHSDRSNITMNMVDDVDEIRVFDEFFRT